jgi:DNA-directed RNA polymerase subunit beta'
MSETNSRTNDFEAVRISLASPCDIRSWSYGEVKKPGALDPSTGRPQRDGLFCERIFGPEKDWECSCGKYRGTEHEGTACDYCGVKVLHSAVRNERMGHIELAAPVVHPWYLRAMPSRIGLFLDMKTTSLEKIIYFQDRVVVDAGLTSLRERQLLTEWDYRKALEYHGDSFQAEMGAEAVKKLIERIDVRSLARELREQLYNEMDKEGGGGSGRPATAASWFRARGKASKQKLRALVKRLKVVEAFRDSATDGLRNYPEWMVLTCIPVIPPGQRPLVRSEDGEAAISDINVLYRRIINRNDRLIKLCDLNAPEAIIRNEKLQLQLAVDALLGSGVFAGPLLGSNRRLKPPSAREERQRGPAFVVGPELKLHQCGLPRQFALDLYRPFVIRRLLELGLADSPEGAGEAIERKDKAVWRVLEEVGRGHPVLISRKPALQRADIQAFEPVLIEGNVIRLHPLVFSGLNADFGGDQMAVCLPLSIEAQVEATMLMTPGNNIFSPANGQPFLSPSQDIVMGCYYLTAAHDEGQKGEGMVFACVEEVFAAWGQNKLGTHARIKVRLQMSKRLVSMACLNRTEEVARQPNGLVTTTVGRVLFNDILNPKMAFYDVAMTSKQLARVISDCYLLLGRRETIELLDRMKELGFREATRSGLSLATDDLKTPTNKLTVLGAAQQAVDACQDGYDEGNFCESERRNTTIDLWGHARHEISMSVMEGLKNDRRDNKPSRNPIYLMAHSGARGGIEQIRQLCGMLGLVVRPNGTTSETPIKANFREGLSVLEYFSSALGMRRGLTDAARKMADSGRLTRKLADVAQDIVVTMHDCGTNLGIAKSTNYKGGEVERPLSEVVRGRVLLHEMRDPSSGELLAPANGTITAELATRIERIGFDKVMVRSPMTCKAPRGVCRLCYGMDLATGALVEEGMAVGIIAAQSLGQPVTQPALARLTELFEARTPRNPAMLAQVGGIVRIGEKKRGKRSIFVLPTDEQWHPILGAPEREHIVPGNQPPRVVSGERVKPGDQLVVGPLVPHDILDIMGPDAAQRYLLDEVQKAFRSKHIEIDDKHIEIIVARMLRTVLVKRGGDTGLLPGSLLDWHEFISINERLEKERVKIKEPGDSQRFKADDVVKKEAYEEERARLEDAGKKPPTRTKVQKAHMRIMLLGITEATLVSEPILSAACSREKARVLIDAALRGKVDHLLGLKENVVLGRLIPAGTGFTAQPPRLVS